MVEVVEVAEGGPRLQRWMIDWIGLGFGWEPLLKDKNKNKKNAQETEFCSSLDITERAQLDFDFVLSLSLSATF